VFVRRRGLGVASTRFAAGAAERDGAGGVACATVTGVVDGVAGAGTGVGAGFDGSDLATAFSLVLGGAAFTGVTGFGGVVDFDAVVVVGVAAFGVVVADAVDVVAVLALVGVTD